MPVWIRKFEMSGTVSLPVFENECHTLLCEWCSRNYTNPCHDHTVAPLWARNNFPAALSPHFFQLKERWRVGGHPAWSHWCLSPTNCFKNPFLSPNNCSAVEIWEWESAGRWSLVTSCTSQCHAWGKGSGGGLRVPSLCPGAVLRVSGQGEMLLQLSQLQWTRKCCFPSLLSKLPSFLGSQQSHPPLGTPAWPYWGFW